MGVYQDIQDDLSEAMSNDLIDAVSTLVITEEVNNGVYDPLIGQGATYTPSTYTMNCIILGDKEEEEDYVDTSTDFVNLLILDKDKIASTLSDFKPGMKATIRNTDYEIGKIISDPVNATHEIKCRKI